MHLFFYSEICGSHKYPMKGILKAMFMSCTVPQEGRWKQIWEECFAKERGDWSLYSKGEKRIFTNFIKKVSKKDKFLELFKQEYGIQFQNLITEVNPAKFLCFLDAKDQASLKDLMAKKKKNVRSTKKRKKIAKQIHEFLIQRSLMIPMKTASGSDYYVVGPKMVAEHRKRENDAEGKI